MCRILARTHKHDQVLLRSSLTMIFSYIKIVTPSAQRPRELLLRHQQNYSAAIASTGQTLVQAAQSMQVPGSISY